MLVTHFTLQVQCEMILSVAGSKSTGLAYFNGDSCDDGWEKISDSIPRTILWACKGNANRTDCYQIHIKTNGVNFNEVYGKVLGYQKGNTTAFNTPVHRCHDIDAEYVDGVSITVLMAVLVSTCEPMQLDTLLLQSHPVFFLVRPILEYSHQLLWESITTASQPHLVLHHLSLISLVLCYGVAKAILLEIAVALNCKCPTSIDAFLFQPVVLWVTLKLMDQSFSDVATLASELELYGGLENWQRLCTLEMGHFTFSCNCF